MKKSFELEIVSQQRKSSFIEDTTKKLFDDHSNNYSSLQDCGIQENNSDFIMEIYIQNQYQFKRSHDIYSMIGQQNCVTHIRNINETELRKMAFLIPSLIFNEIQNTIFIEAFRREQNEDIDCQLDNHVIESEDNILIKLIDLDLCTNEKQQILVLFKPKNTLIFTSSYNSATLVYRIMTENLGFVDPNQIANQEIQQTLPTSESSKVGIDLFEIKNLNEQVLILLFNEIIQKFDFKMYQFLEFCAEAETMACQIAYTERQSFLGKLRNSYNEHIVLFDIIANKIQVFDKIGKSQFQNQNIVYFLKNFRSKIESFNAKLKISIKKLKTTEKFVNTLVQQKYAKVSLSLDSLMKFFSVITTIFLPLCLIANQQGTNVLVPGREETNLLPFGLILITMLCVSLVLLLIFKKYKYC